MGQQQLLLIILGIIIIGVAIVVGINLFTANAIETKRNNLMNDCITLATMAQQHYKKPIAIGGGGNTFDGSTGGVKWTVPPSMTENADGRFYINVIKPQSVELIAVGNEVVTGNDSVEVKVVVTPTGYTTTIIQ